MTATSEVTGTRSLWVEFFFSRVLILVISRPNYGDLASYYEGASRFLTKGTAYGDDGFGYPILALLFVAIPRVLGATEFELYAKVFRAHCFLADMLLFYLLSKRSSRNTLLTYILSTTILANLINTRLDIVLGLLLVIALIMEARRSLGGPSVILGAAIAFKIIPVFLVPAWLSWRIGRRFGVLAFTIGIASATTLPFAIGYVLWGRDALLFLGTHVGRGVQIESIWASIQIVLMQIGSPGEVYFGAGSFNLSGPYEGAFAAVSLACAVVASLWGSVLAFMLARRGQPLALAVSSTVGTLILVSKVFSPQYLLFFIPMMLLSLESLRYRSQITAMALTLTICGLTTWVYPYHELELRSLEPIATFPLIARNVLLLVLVILLQYWSWRLGTPAFKASHVDSDTPIHPREGMAQP